MIHPRINFLHLTFSEICPTQYVKNQAHYSKVISNSLLSPTPSDQCPYKTSTSYNLLFQRYFLDKIFKVKVTTAWLKSNQGHTMTLHTHLSMAYVPSINFIHLTVFEIKARQDLKVKVTTRSKVKSR